MPPGINDGAAALVITSKDKAAALGVKPMAAIRAYGSSGVDPSVMGIGPVPATRKALARADLRLDDIGPHRGKRGICGTVSCSRKGTPLEPRHS